MDPVVHVFLVQRKKKNKKKKKKRVAADGGTLNFSANLDLDATEEKIKDKISEETQSLKAHIENQFQIVPTEVQKLGSFVEQEFKKVPAVVSEQLEKVPLAVEDAMKSRCYDFMDDYPGCYLCWLTCKCCLYFWCCGCCRTCCGPHRRPSSVTGRFENI